MYILVLYDIPGDKLRKQLANYCLDVGLERLQYSIYLGWGNKPKLQKIAHHLEQLVGTEEGLVHIMPLHKDQLAATQVIYNHWKGRR